jgi:hypothetical protein
MLCILIGVEGIARGLGHKQNGSRAQAGDERNASLGSGRLRLGGDCSGGLPCLSLQLVSRTGALAFGTPVEAIACFFRKEGRPTNHFLFDGALCSAVHDQAVLFSDTFPSGAVYE